MVGGVALTGSWDGGLTALDVANGRVRWTFATGAAIRLPRKPVVLSFDDGYPGDVDIAMPTLRAHDWSGVLNLQIDNIVPARVRLLIAAGWEIDSHTFTHPDLTQVSAAQLAREVATSRTWIRNVFKRACELLLLPVGQIQRRRHRTRCAAPATSARRRRTRASRRRTTAASPSGGCA